MRRPEPFDLKSRDAGPVEAVELFGELANGLELAEARKPLEDAQEVASTDKPDWPVVPCRAEGPDCVLLTEGVGDDKERRRPPAEARAPDLPQGLVVRVAGMSDLKAADEPALGDPLAAGGDDLCPWNRRKGGE